MGGRDRLAVVMALLLLTLGVVVACDGGSSKPEPIAGLTELCQPLGRADSFRYVFSYRLESPQQEGEANGTAVGDPPFAIQAAAPDFLFGQTFDGAFQKPDKIDVTTKTEGALTEDTRFVYIGQDQWVELGGQWQKTPPEAPPYGFAPIKMCNAMLSGLDLAGVEPHAETMDGERVARYEVKDAQLGTAIAVWSGQSDMGRLLDTYAVPVWLSEDEEIPVRIESKSVGTYPFGREITMELALEASDINAGDIKIEPPIVEGS